MTVKTDNALLAPKLALRRYFLEKYHHDGSAQVLDCCQAQGVIWVNLRKDFAVKSYWGIDVKPKKGRLKLDSSRVLSQPGWPQDVIDIDTYGSPWVHWLALLENLGDRAATVFLTIGQGMKGNLSRQPKAVFDALGIRLEHFNSSANTLTVIQSALAELAAIYLLSEAEKKDKLLVEAVEAFPQQNARYIGVRIEPRKDGGPGLVTPTHQHATPVSEVQHV